MSLTVVHLLLKAKLALKLQVSEHRVADLSIHHLA